MNRQIANDILAKALMAYKAELTVVENSVDSLAEIDQVAAECGAAMSSYYSPTDAAPAYTQYRLEFRMTAETEGFEDGEYEERLLLTDAQHERVSAFLQKLLDADAIAPIELDADPNAASILFIENPDNEVLTFSALMKGWADPGYLFDLGKKFNVNF
jgi:hypothetical protein